MAHIWWIALAVFLTAPAIDAVSAKKLADVVEQILNEYQYSYKPAERRPPSMFSVAMSIPYNAAENTYDFRDVDESKEAKAAMVKCQVHTGPRVVAATVLKYEYAKSLCPQELVPWDHVTQKCGEIKWAELDKCPEFEALKTSYNWLVDHAEYRVIKNFDKTFGKANEESRKSDLMLFYVFKNPCSRRCARSGQFGILTELKKIKGKWSNVAFAFTRLYIPNFQGRRSNVEEEHRESVKALGNVIGLDNVFRCLNGWCTRCFLEGAEDNINEDCVKDRVDSG